MKKILAVSLVAMMAVSTARADIASTAYVTGAVNAEKALRDSADTAIKNSIGTVSAANMGTTASTVVTAIKEHSDELATMASSETVENLQESLSSLTTTVNGKQATLTTSNVTTSGNGNVVTAVTAADGKVTVTKGTSLGSLATKSTIATGDITDGTITNADISSSAAIDQGKISGLTSALSGKQATLTTAQLSAANSGITSDKVSTYDTAATNASAAKGVTDLISAGATGSDGTYVLTATVSNNTVTGYKWELIDRSY